MSEAHADVGMILLAKVLMSQPVLGVKSPQSPQCMDFLADKAV